MSELEHLAALTEQMFIRLAQITDKETKRLHERIDRLRDNLVNRIRTIEVAMRIE